jgi:hypothetical protein
MINDSIHKLQHSQACEIGKRRERPRRQSSNLQERYITDHEAKIKNLKHHTEIEERSGAQMYQGLCM